MDYSSNLLSEEYEKWFQFFRNKIKWVCVDDQKYLYFTKGKTYDLDYVDYENNDVYLIMDNGRDDVPISFNTLINNFESLEEWRDQKLRMIGL